MAFDPSQPWEFGFQSDDGSTVLSDYVKYVANKGLLRYRRIIHTGGKAGESLWTHVMNLVTVIEKLRPIFELSRDEMACLLLALTVHDLNKVDSYGKRPEGKPVRYANAAAKAHIEEELKDLQVSSFFLWEPYLIDITYLAHAHQEGTMVATVLNQREIDQCHLNMGRLEGALKFLMKVADVSDNSHSGAYDSRHEKHIRHKLLNHVNGALNADNRPPRYGFVGHRLAEQRGLMTNIIHNEIVAYMQATYGKTACIDLLYHPEGVDYLLDTRLALPAITKMRKDIANRIGQKFAGLQFEQLAQFIKATPSGISVDDAAMQSGATLEQIFSVIANTVLRKIYRLEWREQRNALVRSDLEAALADEKTGPELQERIMQLLCEKDLVSTDDDVLRKGEFVAAYRNFLKDHRADQLKAIKQEAWMRVARLFQLPTAADNLYSLVDPYRRGYFMARDLEVQKFDEMEVMVIADLVELEELARGAIEKRKGKKSVKSKEDEGEEGGALAFDAAYIVDYLERHLEIWDSRNGVADTQLVEEINFTETLQRYADAKRLYMQCCYCGSPLKADEWMSIQVPPNIGVQSFSNRLEAGSLRDPKRNVCDICRTQFILEKLAWRAHRDKQGGSQVTFYLHLFPYTYYTQPLLQAWWQSIEKLRDGKHNALFFETQGYFREWERFQAGVAPDFYRSSTDGVGIPTLAEAMSNTPVLPVIVSGSNYGMQFLQALEQAVLIANLFNSRVILSRMPIPSLNLANEKSQDEPIALLVENAPSSIGWLLPQTALTLQDVKTVCRKLSSLHQLVDRLIVKDERYEETIYDFVVAAAADPLALYYEVDRLIEQKATHKKGRKPEYQAIELAQAVGPFMGELTRRIEGED